VFQKILFFAFSAASIISALIMISVKHMIISAICLMITFAFLAGLYILLNAQFIAALQIIIYSGAIVVLFLFVIMLIQIKEKIIERKRLLGQKIFGILLALVLFGLLLSIFLPSLTIGEMGEFSANKINLMGNTEALSHELFVKYIYPFEIVSIVLLAAILGAVILTKKEI
jgi:NADH-quinone oxidoreductase subunit J